jgi:DNA adenine methylase
MPEAAGGAARIGPVLKWPGSKWRIAEWIVGFMPQHKVYVEPYFGSGACYFRKSPARLSTLNDLDCAVVEFFRVLRDRPADLAAAVALTPWSRVEWERSFAPCDEDVEAARRFLVRSQQSHGMRPRRRTGWRHATGASAAGGGGIRDVAGQWANLPPLLLAAAEQLRGAQLECRPALDVIARYRHAGALLYIDPPYIRATRSEWQYRCEMSDAEHVALLDALGDHPGPVLLSGYRSDLYDARLGHWRRVDRAAWAEKGRPRVESLWLNPVAVAALAPERQAALDFGLAAGG